MLTLDLARLERERTVRVQANLPADDPLWEGSCLTLEGPLSVDLQAQEATSGDVVVRGSVKGVLRQECRRCLEPVHTVVNQSIALVYSPKDVLADDEDGEVRPISHGTRQLALGEAVREELILTVAPFVECGPECKGLCPRCGVNLNEETCACAPVETDPRWDVLRALKNE